MSDHQWGPPASTPPPASQTPGHYAPQQRPRAGPPPAQTWGHPTPATTGRPHVEFASPWLRLGCNLLEGLLFVVTLGVGWLIWGAIVAGEGQTPAKKLLGLRVIRTDSGRPASWPWMVFMRGIVAGWVAQLAILFTVGVLAFMPFWDRRNQNVWDKVSGCVVVRDPDGRLRTGLDPLAIA